MIPMWYCNSAPRENQGAEERASSKSTNTKTTYKEERMDDWMDLLTALAVAFLIYFLKNFEIKKVIIHLERRRKATKRR